MSQKNETMTREEAVDFQEKLAKIERFLTIQGLNKQKISVDELSKAIFYFKSNKLAECIFRDGE